MRAVIHLDAVFGEAVAVMRDLVEAGVEWDLSAKDAQPDLLQKQQIVVGDANAHAVGDFDVRRVEFVNALAGCSRRECGWRQFQNFTSASLHFRTPSSA